MRLHDENVLLALFHLVGRNRRRYGGYIVHAGVVMLMCAFAGLAFKKEFDVTLRQARRSMPSIPGHQWQFVSQGICQFDALNRQVTAVSLKPTRDGKPMPVIESEKRQHVDSRGSPTFEPSTAVGIYERPSQDVYVVFTGVIGVDTAESGSPSIRSCGGCGTVGSPWPSAVSSSCGRRRIVRRRRVGTRRCSPGTGGVGRRRRGVMLTRRRFVGAVTAAAAGTVLGPRMLAAATRSQGSQQDPGSASRRRGSENATPAVGVRTTMSGPMDTDAYHAVSLPPKAGAGASMSVGQRDALEHDLHCQCGCTLDVFTCRTTDFTCSVSPAMHCDVMQLVDGGYSKAEIIGAFRAAYGERVLMAPVAEGFNWAAYLTPFVALGAGAAGWRCSSGGGQLRRGRQTRRGIDAGSRGSRISHARRVGQLDAAIRDDTR